MLARSLSVLSLYRDIPLSAAIYKLSSIDLHSRTYTSQRMNTLMQNLGNFSWLGSISPCFPIRGSQVTVITKPSDFYNEVLKRSESSAKRITLASLYLGTGPLERNLVNTLTRRLEQNPGKLKVCILLDFARSSRQDKHGSSCSLLLPMLSSHQKSCMVALYHTPALRGIFKTLLPQRYNELVGLQHMKVYLFDDSVIISGANLSNDYFTNRQDRYVLIDECKDLADFLDGLVKKVADFSLHLTPDNTFEMSKNWEGKGHPYLGNKDIFVDSARRHVYNYYSDHTKKTFTCPQADTWVFPLIEMGQLGIQVDSTATKRLIERAPADSRLEISTGYFNVTKEYSQSIYKYSKASFNILMAHPSANGFLGARGPAGGIPFAYTLLAHQFLTLVTNNNQRNRIKLWEYQRPGWTYHAKGMWYSLPAGSLPSLTLIGSPNFGYRSLYRDLELQAALVTTDSGLREQLANEHAQLSARTSPFPENVLTDSERKPPLWVRLVVAFFRNFF